MKNSSNTMPGVSIYIIAYLGTTERAELLKSVCENALAMDYPEFEVIVSDNAGPLRVEEALRSIRDPRLKVFRNEENLGFAGNFNTCLERCSHDIIKFNCDDDLLHPDFLKLTVPLVDDETFVVSNYEKYVIGKPPAALSEPMPRKPDVEILQPGYARAIWKPDYISLPGCVLFTRAFYEALGGYNPESVLPDWDLMIEAHLRKKVSLVKHTLCYMGVWSDSISVKSLAERPYFFEHGWLYTKFRILSHPAMSAADRFNLRAMLAVEFVWQTIRAIRYMFRKNYRTSYALYAKTFLGYCRNGVKTTGSSAV